MAEIKIGNARYVTLDDKTASAESDSWSETTFQKTVKIEGKEYTVTRLGWARYVKNIPDSVTSIENMCNCSNINIPDSVTSMGNMYDCSNITIPDSVTSMGYMSNCSNITIPDSVTFIGKMYECSNITIPDSITMLNGIYRSTLTIPASVTTIKEIDGENGTLFLRMESAIPPALAKATRLAKDDMLIVPEGAAEAYKKHSVWGKFKNISEDPRLNADSVSSPSSDKVSSKQKEKTEPKKETPKPQSAPAPKQETKRPSSDDMDVLDRLIDSALEDFVVTDEERKVLLKKSKEIGLGEDEFKIYLNGKIQERMKDKPAEKVEEKKKGFFARLFGK